MGRSASMASVALAILGFCNVAYSQTSITKFDEVAGKWAGHAAPHNHNVTLEIDGRGRFKARSPLGGESGEARLEGGALVILLSDHQGSLRLVLDGDTLKGPGLLDGKTWMVNLARTGPRVKAD
jgi:hypothetical protein